MKKFFRKTKTVRNKNAFKIYYLLKKQAEFLKNNKEYEISTRKFLKNKDPSRNFASYYIQSCWRQYNEHKKKVTTNNYL